MKSRLVNLRREYDPAGPLFARRRIKLRGVVYERGSVLPELSKVRHQRLWQSGLGDHRKTVPLAGNTKTAAPVAVVEAAAPMAPVAPAVTKRPATKK